MMKKNIHLIFDFDGTLVDSLDVVTANYNLLANEFNFRQIANHEIASLKNLTSLELIKHLQIPIYKIPKIIVRAKELMHSEINKLPAFENLKEVIEQIHKTNGKVGILTSNSLGNVVEWVECNGMENFFYFIHADSSLFGKKRILRQLIKKYKMEPSLTFYIGDETRDVEAAKACHINSIAVTWGFNSESILLQYKPHFVARKPADILQIYEKLNNI